MAVVGIGPKVKTFEYRQVLDEIGGENVFFVGGFDSLDKHIKDILKLICRKYKTRHQKS